MNEDIPFVNPEAFTDPTIRQKIHDRLILMGVTIYEHCRLQSIEKDDTNCLKAAIFKRLDIVEEDVEDLANNSRAMNEGEDNEDNLSAEGEEIHVVKKRGKRSELELYCKVLVTAGHRNVDPDVFNSIHNNRLVYNGRLIVDKNFQTTDMSIFAAGSL